MQNHRRHFTETTLTLAIPLSVSAKPLQSTMAQLEAGDLKLRVRVLEGERADRRSGVVQVRGRVPAGLLAWLHWKGWG